MQNIINKLTPGNYWLTKSMEFNKGNTSGTLWYLKKWITYYYFIFLKKDLYTKDFNEIKQIFENFIKSLPKEVHTRAELFFFEKDIRDIEKYYSYNNFISDFKRSDILEVNNNRVLLTKKFYFAYIMNIGGQAGYKRITKDLIDKGNTFEQTLEAVKLQMQKDGRSENDFNQQILSDFHASLRNERQIFFYYGIFHGKQAANLDGFYNLTPIGKSILNFGFDELIILWEHQKIKMISQSPNSEINNINTTIELENVSINVHPYLTLLKSISSLNGLEFSIYKYGISRTNSILRLEDLIPILKSQKQEFVNQVTNITNNFNRRADIEPEDFTKELKKFLLGIYEMNMDLGTNPYSFLSFTTNREIIVNNHEKLEFTILIYSKIVKNLDSKYNNKYEQFEITIKEKYNNNNYIATDTLKYEWAKYIINLDDSILLYLVYWSLCLKLNKFDFKLKTQQIKNYLNNYKKILIKLGLNKKDFLNIIIEIQELLKNNETYNFVHSYQEKYNLIEPKDFNIQINIKNLEEISKQSLDKNGYDIINRNRNFALIRDLKTFFLHNFTNEKKLIPCECCKEITFINNNNLPYLEFHHLIPFSTDNGPDHYLNLFGLCSNCHSKMHHLHPSFKSELYSNLLTNNHFKKNFIERVEILMNDGFIEAIHLDFLHKENIIDKVQYNDFMNRQYNTVH